MDFYQILLGIIKEKELSIPEVARLCGLTDSTVRSMIDRKQKKVALNIAFKLSNGLGVSLERLNGDTKNSPSKNVNVPSDKVPFLGKVDALKELGKQYKLDTLDQSIIKNYIQLSPAQREVIKQYLYNIVDDVLSDENYESFREGYLDSHPVQMAASNGDTSGLEEIIAQFEAADNIHLDSKKDTKK